jgi:hypothetical protein
MENSPHYYYYEYYILLLSLLHDVQKKNQKLHKFRPRRKCRRVQGRKELVVWREEVTEKM